MARMVMSVKTCTSCTQRLRDSDFYRDGNGAPYSPCKDCRRAAARARHAVTRERARGNFERLVTA